MGKNDFHRIKIARGLHRGKVKNIEVSWRKFCEILAQPSVDQSITYAEYCALSVDEQGKRKSAPGYIVGAHFEDGKRRLVNMKKRHLISFDLDTVTPEQMAEIDMGVSPLCDYEFERHTTRKHCPERPRWRIHLPITRPVGHDEANAITRILASRIFSDPQESIDAVDVVSHRFAQVSYLPSRSKDQEYIHERNEGDLLDPDALLDSFDGDWTDHSQLPMRSDEKSARPADPNRKMEDPREKPGIIGAWCRTYDVEQVIQEYLGEVYEEGDAAGGPPRYSYLPGQGSNGAVVYDDGLFLHSNHGTDPVQGSVNAWDLARIHLFGHLDKDAREDTSPGNLPSFKAMAKFADGIAEVREELLANRRDQFDDDEEDEPGDPGADEDEDDEPRGIASKFDADEDEEDDFLADFLGEEPEEKPKADKKAKKDKKAANKWRALLKANLETGAILKSAHNVNLIFQNDPGFAGTISYNQFWRKTVTRKPVGFPGLALAREAIPNPANGREWLDCDTFDRKLILAAPEEQGGYNMEATLLDIETAVETAARNNPFHPVIEKLEALPHDGTPRGESLFIDYLGVADNAYHREAARAWLTAAVARLYEPGHKFDHVPVLGGAQGVGKSSFVKALGYGYFGELASTWDNHQRMVESTLGFWVLEIGELAGLSKAEVETVKQFLSATEDTVRLAYRRNPETFQRQCVFFGSTNKDQYLKDETGNRRFWPIKVQVSQIDLERLRRNVPQIWAEALVWYKDARAAQPHGDLPLYLRSAEARAFAEQAQDDSRTESAAEIMANDIQRWLDRPVPASVAENGEDARFDEDGEAGEPMVRRTRAKVADLWHDCLGHTRPASPMEVTTLGAACNLIEGWRKEKRRFGGERSRWLVREGSDAWEAGWEPVPEAD